MSGVPKRKARDLINEAIAEGAKLRVTGDTQLSYPGVRSVRVHSGRKDSSLELERFLRHIRRLKEGRRDADVRA